MQLRTLKKSERIKRKVHTLCKPIIHAGKKNMLQQNASMHDHLLYTSL